MVRIKKEAVLVKPKHFRPSSDKLEIIGTINPSATRLANGDILMYVRIIEKLKEDESGNYYLSPRMVGKQKYKLKIDKFKKSEVVEKNDMDFVFKDDTKRLTFISHIRRVYLHPNGLKIKKVEQLPALHGLSWDGELGIEDPRIVKMNDHYLMTYVSLARESNISTSAAVSNDCINWYRKGLIFREQNKDVVIFPEMFDKKYIALNRPEGNFQFSAPHMWISYSSDLHHWGKSKPFILGKKGKWDAGRVGAGPPPIKTKKGWLLIYHGVVMEEVITDPPFRKAIKKFFHRELNKEQRFDYVVGAALLDLKNPRKILAKTPEPIIKPNQKHEKGTFEQKDVVFPTGLVLDQDKKHFLIYSGGGDVVTTVKKVAIKDILDSLRKPS